MKQFEVDSHAERLAEECLEASSRVEEGKAEDEQAPQTAMGQEAPPGAAAMAKEMKGKGPWGSRRALLRSESSGGESCVEEARKMWSAGGASRVRLVLCGSAVLLSVTAVLAVSIWMGCYYRLVHSARAPELQVASLDLERTWMDAGSLNAQVLLTARLKNREKYAVHVVPHYHHRSSRDPALHLKLVYYPGGDVPAMTEEAAAGAAAKDKHEQQQQGQGARGKGAARGVELMQSLPEPQSIPPCCHWVDLHKRATILDVLHKTNGSQLAREALSGGHSSFRLVGQVPITAEVTPWVWAPVRFAVDCTFRHHWGERAGSSSSGGPHQDTEASLSTVCNNHYASWW